MTRRARGKGRVLSLDTYIHRATLGLPREERLDAAAELRTHLLERVAEHEAQGFSREEAEYLAVKGMGGPQTVNRGLLGHVFTNRLGWVALAALLVGGGGWYAWREWLPPAEGVNFEAVTPADVARLFADSKAPRGSYQAMTLTFPKGTRSVAYVNVADGDSSTSGTGMMTEIKDVEWLTKATIMGRVPGSYRYQERWLIASERLSCHGLDRQRLFVKVDAVPSPFRNQGRASTGIASAVNTCDNPSLLLTTGKYGVREADGAGSTTTTVHPRPVLKLNQWTVLKRLVVDPQRDPNVYQSPEGGGYSSSARGAYVAVMPLDHPAQEGMISPVGEDTRITDKIQVLSPLPPLPPLVP